jgi:hypothetical protein
LAADLAGAIRCRGFTRGVAQLGSALRSGRRGRGFESRHPDCVVADQSRRPSKRGSPVYHLVRSQSAADSRTCSSVIDAAEALRNPHPLSFALLSYGYAFLDADPDVAREAMRRGVVIAQDSGNRTIETHLTSNLARLEAQHGDPLAALDYYLVTIRHLHDSGNSATLRAVLATSPPFSTGSSTTRSPRS